MIQAKHVTGFAGMAILMLGCQSQVIGGGGDGGGGAGGSAVTTTAVTTTTSTSTGADPGTPPNPNDGPAIAMLRSQVPDIDAGGDTTVGGGTDPALDPNDLMIYLGDTIQTCNNPYGQGCTKHFQVGIQLPPSEQVVGTYPLQDHAYMSVSFGGDPNECSGGGGSYWDGTISITAIDAASVSFTLAGTGDIFGDPTTADGSYVAKRCF